jgi:hypothetical protein
MRPWSGDDERRVEQVKGEEECNVDLEIRCPGV